MKRVITITGIMFALSFSALADNTTSIVVPLTYTGRSTESAAAIASSSTLGGEVTTALALPLNPSQTIFDGGAYHTEDVTPTGVTWASWAYYGPPDSTYQARHFQATFVLPSDMSNVQGFTLFSPYYTAAGNYVIVDDNSYFYLNGNSIGHKGTSYGASNAPLSVPGLDIHETNGWHQDGSFGSAPLAFLHPGTNTLDIVEEDTGLGGSTGPLNLLLVVPEPTTIFLALSAIPLLFCLRRKSVH